MRELILEAGFVKDVAYRPFRRPARILQVLRSRPMDGFAYYFVYTGWNFFDPFSRFVLGVFQNDLPYLFASRISRVVHERGRLVNGVLSNQRPLPWKAVTIRVVIW